MSSTTFAVIANIDEYGTLTVNSPDNLLNEVKRVTLMMDENRRTTFYPDGDGE